MSQLSENLFPPEVIAYLEEIKKKYSSDQVIYTLEKATGLRILIIGETIIDEYVFCDAIGKSGKEAMLVMQFDSMSQYAGGVLAVANHIANFCGNISLASYLGIMNPNEAFVREHLHSNITPYFISKTDSPTIIKRRILDKYSNSKLLGVYELNDQYLSEDEESEFIKILKPLILDCDAVVVADYGHGLITEKVIEFLVENAPFLAVNTQVNASNFGFHTVSRYPHADFVCVNENELHMDYRSRQCDLKEIIVNLSSKLDCKYIIVTRGSNGSLTFKKDEGFFSCPAFATKVIDRIGAGDAVFAITALLAIQSAPANIINLIANLVGSQAVTIVGNQESICKEPLFSAIRKVLN